MIDGVRHDPKAARYELSVGHNTALVAYRREGEIVTFTHTSVPKELEGQGVASRLIAGALNDVRDQNLKMIAECSFVASYVKRHPEVQDLMTEWPRTEAWVANREP